MSSILAPILCISSLVIEELKSEGDVITDGRSTPYRLYGALALCTTHSVPRAYAYNSKVRHACSLDFSICTVHIHGMSCDHYTQLFYTEKRCFNF